MSCFGLRASTTGCRVRKDSTTTTTATTTTLLITFPHHLAPVFCPSISKVKVFLRLRRLDYLQVE